MDRKNILIIVLVIIAIILIIAIGAMVLNNNNTVNKNITMNNMNFTVPNSTDSVNNTTDGWARYISKDISIYSFKSSSANNLGNLISSGAEFNVLRGSIQVNVHEEVVDGVKLNKSDTTGNYSYEYGNNTTHQNIIIVCKDPNLLASVVKSMKYVGDLMDSNSTSNTSSTGCSNCANGNQGGSYYWVGNKQYCSVCHRLVADLDDAAWQAEEARKRY